MFKMLLQVRLAVIRAVAPCHYRSDDDHGGKKVRQSTQHVTAC